MEEKEVRYSGYFVEYGYINDDGEYCGLCEIREPYNDYGKQGDWDDKYHTTKGLCNNGLKVGEWKTYKYDGVLLHTETYDSEGNQIFLEEYFADGNVYFNFHYDKNGLRHGYSEINEKTGQHRCKGVYEKGTEKGLWYFNTNDLRMEDNYRYYL